MLTKPADAPEQVENRTTGGETQGLFALAAKKLFRREDRSAFVHHAFEYLTDTLDWLHLWNWNEPQNDFDDYDDTVHSSAYHDDYSLHL